MPDDDGAAASQVDAPSENRAARTERAELRHSSSRTSRYPGTTSRCRSTANHDADIRRRAQAAEALGWLPKPYTMPSLVRLVRKALSDLHAANR